MKPCIACLIRPSKYRAEVWFFCLECAEAWCESPFPPSSVGVARFLIQRREEALKPVPMVEPT